MIPRLLHLSALIALSLSPQLVQGAKYFQHADQLPKGQEYDFIVVGSGPGGSTVATRIAQQKDFNVLIIEAGPSDEEFPQIPVPGFVAQLSAFDWNFTTIPQVGAGNRALTYSRARVLGGCTSHNGMVYTRGSKDDYDQWASLVGDTQLSWNNMYPNLLKNERYMQTIDNQNEFRHLDPSVHGHSGNIGVSAPYSIHPMNDLILNTTRVLKDEFPFKLDYNDGSPVGVGWSQFSVQKGVRSSAVSGYLSTTGNNVHILLNTYVTRVVPTQDDLSFRGVEFATGKQGSPQRLEAKREVILAGGVINTPQILLNSGIGDDAELQAFGIKTLVNNPSVGKNLSDQVSVLGVIPSSLPSTNFNSTIALEEWERAHTGPLALANALNHIGWVRLGKQSAALEGHSDPAPGIKSPHIEFVPLVVTNVTGIGNAGGKLPPIPGVDLDNAFVLVVTNLHTVSRGSVTLSSSDPFDHPLIDFNMFGSDLDVAILREGVRSALRFFSASPWKGKLSDAVFPPANITSSDELMDSFLRTAAFADLHGVGTASMSPKGASWGVVDPDFRVKGTKGLRIVDASVLPSVPSGHTQVPVYAFAERAAEVILQSIGKH